MRIWLLSRVDFHWVEVKGMGMHTAAQEAARPISLRVQWGGDIYKAARGKKEKDNQERWCSKDIFGYGWYLILLFAVSNDVVSPQRAHLLAPSLHH